MSRNIAVRSASRDWRVSATSPFSGSSIDCATATSSGLFHSTQQLGLVDRFDAELLRLFEFAARILADDDEARLFRDAACDPTAIGLDQRIGLFTGERRKRPCNDDGQALQRVTRLRRRLVE